EQYQEHQPQARVQLHAEQAQRLRQAPPDELGGLGGVGFVHGSPSSFAMFGGLSVAVAPAFSPSPPAPLPPPGERGARTPSPTSGGEGSQRAADAGPLFLP